MTSEVSAERRGIALIVDDDSRSRAVLRHLLELAGWTVYEAADGREGLRAYRQRSPDLVITDIDMPKMDGVEMAACIRGLPGSVPVLAATRSRLEGAVCDVFDDVVRKPFSPGDFRDWLTTR